MTAIAAQPLVPRALALPVRAGFVSRMMAVVADAVILGCAFGATAWLLQVSAVQLRRFAPPIDLGGVLLAAAPFLVALYHIGFWAAVGQTPGKWLLRIRVVGPGGGRPSIGRASVRWLGYLVSAFPCYLGFLWVLGHERLAWHDHLAHTEVVRSFGMADPSIV